MKHIFYGIKYLINYQVFKKSTPLICGLVLTNGCNLRCRHCKVNDRGSKFLDFQEITTVINSFYKEGGRSIYLQGGEPFFWRDRQYSLEDIVQYAYKIGFFAVVIYTNGTFPIITSANTVFISIDGLQKTHDFLRGVTFNKIIKNIRESNHSSLYINYTINNYNKDEIEEYLEYMDKINKIRGTFFYFHTPYYGYDDLYIEPAERKEILSRLLQYKKKYKILNSRAGLKSALRDEWKRPLDICYVYEKGNMYKCCRVNSNYKLCKNCGYLSYAEINQIFKLKPSAIVNAFKYL